MQCYNCKANISINDENKDNRTIAVLHKEKYYCLPCHEVLIFICDDSKKVKIKEQEKPKQTVNHYSCMKCKKHLSVTNPKCEECNFTHPLLIGNSKKNKKRSKKKKK